MTKEQFWKIVEANGVDMAIASLSMEEDCVVGLEALLEIVADDIADWVSVGEFDKAIKYTKMLQDYDGTQYWYYDYKDSKVLKPLQYAEDVQFLLTAD